jgi:hypothetical protein
MARRVVEKAGIEERRNSTMQGTVLHGPGDVRFDEGDLPRPEFAVCGKWLEIRAQIQGVTEGAAKACAYACSGRGRREAPTGFGLTLGNKGFGSLTSDRPAALGDQVMELT